MPEEVSHLPFSFTGRQVRLAMPEAEQDASTIAGWTARPTFLRLMVAEPVRPWLKEEEQRWIEETRGDDFVFCIRTISDDTLIGVIDISAVQWQVQQGWLAVAIGEPEYWDRGFGSEAMQIIIRYGFEELGLRRLSLTVFEYNERAIKVYHRLGFKEEGRQRQWLKRDGKRWDMIFMGMLKSDYLEANWR